MVVPRPASDGGRGLLFVAGQGRSGTTALVRVLSAHPQIALGIERYKALWGGRIGELTPAAFARSRFFDFDDGLTNITPASSPFVAEHYARLASRWDTAAYRGDKMVAIRIQAMWEVMPEARFVCIVRDAREVAASWQQRADDPSRTGWPATAGTERAVERWNSDAGRILRAQRARPEQVTVLEYGRFFSDPDATSLRVLMGRLGLDMAPELLAAHTAAHRAYADLLEARHRPVGSHSPGHEQVDQGRWARLQTAAI